MNEYVMMYNCIFFMGDVVNKLVNLYYFGLVYHNFWQHSSPFHSCDQASFFYSRAKVHK